MEVFYCFKEGDHLYWGIEDTGFAEEQINEQEIAEATGHTDDKSSYTLMAIGGNILLYCSVASQQFISFWPCGGFCV